MTDRIRSLTITLDHDFRVDDVEVVVNAIKMIRGVVHVQHGMPVDMPAHIARQVARSEIHNKLFDAIHEIFRDPFEKTMQEVKKGTK